MDNGYIKKTKILNGLLVLTSFIGYLEWGTDNSMFLIQGEIDVISKLVTSPTQALHPLTIIPLLGQLLLLITLFQEKPGRALTLIGLASLFVLLGFMFFIGCISLNIKIIFSTLPFIIIAFLVMLNAKSSKTQIQ